MQENASPLVSVVLPFRNAERYIGGSIFSILRQSYRNIELICINDCSTDQSMTIVDRFADSRIRTVQFPENRGISAALNAGINLATGDYICRMDADDRSLRSRIADQVSYLRMHTEVDVLGGAIRVFGRSRLRLTKRYPVAHSEIAQEMLFTSPVAHPTVMIRRTAIDKLSHLYSDEFAGVEDYELWTRLLRSGAIFANLEDVVLQYRIHGSNVSLKRSTRIEDLTKRVYAMMFEYLDIPCSSENLDIHYMLNNKLILDENEHRRIDAWFQTLLRHRPDYLKIVARKRMQVALRASGSGLSAFDIYAEWSTIDGWFSHFIGIVCVWMASVARWARIKELAKRILRA